MSRAFMLHALGSPGGRYVLDPGRLGIFQKCGPGDLVTIDDGYRECLELGREWLGRWRAKTALFLVAGRMGGVNDWDSGGEVAGRKLLSWEEAVELQRAGAIFGSHGLTHCDLRCADDRTLRTEVESSKKTIEDKLGVAVDWFAYPYGYFDRRVIDFVKAAGYTRAFTTCDSIWAGRGDPYRARRIEISGLDSDWALRAKITGLYDLKNLWELPGLVTEKLSRSFSARHPSNCRARSHSQDDIVHKVK